MFWCDKLLTVIMVIMIFKTVCAENVQYLGGYNISQVQDIELAVDGSLFILCRRSHSNIYVMKRNAGGIFEIIFQYQTNSVHDPLYNLIGVTEIEITSNSTLYLINKRKPSIYRLSRNGMVEVFAGNGEFGVPDNISVPITTETPLPFALNSNFSCDSYGNLFFNINMPNHDSPLLPKNTDVIFQIDTNRTLSLFAGGGDSTVNNGAVIDKYAWKADTIKSIQHDLTNQLWIAETKRLYTVQSDGNIRHRNFDDYTFLADKIQYVPINNNTVFVLKRGTSDQIIKWQNNEEIVLLDKSNIDPIYQTMPDMFNILLLAVGNHDLYFINGGNNPFEQVNIFKLSNGIDINTGVEHWEQH